MFRCAVKNKTLSENIIAWENYLSDYVKKVEMEYICLIYLASITCLKLNKFTDKTIFALCLSFRTSG